MLGTAPLRPARAHVSGRPATFNAHLKPIAPMPERRQGPPEPLDLSAPARLALHRFKRANFDRIHVSTSSLNSFAFVTISSASLSVATRARV